MKIFLSDVESERVFCIFPSMYDYMPIMLTTFKKIGALSIGREKIYKKINKYLFEGFNQILVVTSVPLLFFG